ncbi:ergosterol biosynthesis ERG4/ERG24 family-domain-containing protein [Thamnocephalis sphaerospora]|uniref:Delta(14)-sterol reductase ERG24 n=1 Tax=Thamnocephalis sphaerospora TaxID=78915 RepID=A0A4P9XTU4_9FUNG|nr:ergosterol biosynthesis ERG4/ERG24 family-domain-containing protein [Thamnocephalis sphaerospora]|eukprot:RKP08981.1 ergosterol biosynthesis ERG4/ERG24 family-domain-containing protein [Thamnocephalis sphaerospora]
MSVHARTVAASTPSAARGENQAKQQQKQQTELNPRTTTREFLGAPGAAAIIVICHAVLYAFYTNCTEDGCPNAQGLAWLVQSPFNFPSGWQSAYHRLGLQVYVGWLSWLLGLYCLVPGRWVRGTVLRNGTTLEYKVNALSALVLTALGCAAGLYFAGPEPFVFVYDHILHVITAGIIIASVLSVYLYTASFLPGKLLALGGNSGNPLYDFFIGRELNPRIGSFDFKYFIELRPGLIGWQVLNFCSAVKQYATHGYLTDSMVMVQVFQLWYVFDSLSNEASVLTTMDVTTDGLGWMLTFGNLCLVPFGFSLQTRYLAAHPNDLGLLKMAGILMLQAFGYWIFRSANSQKDRFRKNPEDPSVKHLSYISTKRGTRLITSGWWGYARHVNYFGDWIMGIAWCLPCGMSSIIPYFYCLYFTALLIHRERRDEHMCHLKYGGDWRRYRRIVPWRIIPYVY